jgi:hypothetical protein
MKKLILIPFLSALSISVFAQLDSTKSRTTPIQYCAEYRDGMLVVKGDNKEITSDITTANGTVIKPNGNIVKKDGVTTILKEGECIDAQGVLVDLITNTGNVKTPKQDKEKTSLSTQR